MPSGFEPCGQPGISRYRAGCRCTGCRAANAARVRRNRERRREDETRLNHGTVSAYDAGCRCQDCRDTRVYAYIVHEGGYRRHWWREFVWETWHGAWHPYWIEREKACNGYLTEEREYREANPPPLFRDFLVALRGTSRGSSP